MNQRDTKQFRSWLFQGMKPSAKQSHVKAPWYKVLCLTGLDYFGSLGYAPGIAALSAGFLAPQATLVLIGLTLFGALPMYHRVAQKSPHGQGSISMLEHLFPGWWGKALVLCLIGFAATDFIITITLSAADAAAHIAQNSYVKELCSSDHWWGFLQDRMGVTYALLGMLAIVFLMGFKEAIAFAVVIVVAYMILNVGVAASGIYEVATHPITVPNWQEQLFRIYKTPWQMSLQALILFPQLALGMSGFETGVAVMPLVKGDPSDTEDAPLGRIRNTRKLLTAAAIIMCTFLLISSITTTLLIPQSDFKEGGAANGRALAFLAHKYLGSIYGTLYDLATIFILWFSGASSLAGLLSLVPRYLPRFGMAPAWARATRPLVLFFALVAFVITYIFKADVDAQGGAYATGVLVLMSSGAFAVFWSIPKEDAKARVMYCLVTLIFAYTTIMNIIQRPEGLHVALFFIITIFSISFISRAVRSTELRTRNVCFDDVAREFIQNYKGKPMQIISHRPGMHDYEQCAEQARQEHHLEGDFVFLEIALADASDFSEDGLSITGVQDGPYHVLQCKSAAVPNAIASILIALRNVTGQIPHAYMYWTEGNPLFYVLKFLFLGDGETAPVTREILRECDHDPSRRPKIHVV
jgi:hypothetical protein